MDKVLVIIPAYNEALNICLLYTSGTERTLLRRPLFTFPGRYSTMMGR